MASLSLSYLRESLVRLTLALTLKKSIGVKTRRQYLMLFYSRHLMAPPFVMNHNSAFKSCENLSGIGDLLATFRRNVHSE
jgi:hypothetical protein